MGEQRMNTAGKSQSIGAISHQINMQRLPLSLATLTTSSSRTLLPQSPPWPCQCLRGHIRLTRRSYSGNDMISRTYRHCRAHIASKTFYCNGKLCLMIVIPTVPPTWTSRLGSFVRVAETELWSHRAPSSVRHSSCVSQLGQKGQH